MAQYWLKFIFITVVLKQKLQPASEGKGSKENVVD